MATTSHNDIALAIYTASKDKQGTEVSLFVDNVLKFLIRKRLISQSSDILKKLEKISNKEEGIIVATISSSKKMGKRRIYYI
jgi:F0F1-type ATP synthase delta subunit